MAPTRLASALGVLLAVTVLTGGCGSDTPRVQEVRGDPDSAELEVTADSCNAHPTAAVEESDTEVRVLLTANRSWGTPTARDAVVVTLAAPLGTRAVVDGATDRRVEVLTATSEVPGRGRGAYIPVSMLRTLPSGSLNQALFNEPPIVATPSSHSRPSASNVVKVMPFSRSAAASASKASAGIWNDIAVALFEPANDEG